MEQTDEIDEMAKQHGKLILKQKELQVTQEEARLEHLMWLCDKERHMMGEKMAGIQQHIMFNRIHMRIQIEAAEAEKLYWQRAVAEKIPPKGV